MEQRENTTMLREQSSEVEIDLLELLSVYLRKWYLFAICGAVAAVLVFLYTFLFVTPQYRASVTIYVNNRTQQQGDVITGTDLNTSTRLVKTYITVAQSNTVRDRAAQRLGMDYSAAKVGKMVTAAQLSDTEMFEVRVVSSDPEEAARVANVMGEVIPEVIGEIIEGSSTRIIDYAEVPRSYFSPNYLRSTMIGLLVGLVLAGVIVTISFLLDTRIKSEDDVTDLCDYPILGMVPEYSVATKRGDSYAYKEDNAQDRGKRR